jgi:hypothetical protein
MEKVMKKTVYTIMVSMWMIGMVEGMKVDSFKAVETFTASILQDRTDAASKIKETISQIAANDRLTKPVRVGMLEELKSGLSDIYPFVTSEVENVVAKNLGLAVYNSGQEKELGILLLESQDPNFSCLDIVLRAVRLLYTHGPDTIETKVVPFMKKNRLESYL